VASLERARGGERIISALRAIIAKELTSRGFSVNETAKLLGVTAAAVSFYVGGKRGANVVRELEQNPKVLELIKSYVDMLVERIRSGKASSIDVADLAKTISAFLSAPEADVGDLEAAIMDRVRVEQETANRAMALSYRVKNPLLRILFLQIAIDSLRHAEILTAISDYLSGRVRAEDLGISEKELETLSEEEMRMREGISPLYRIEDPVIRSLLLSIELDEVKHYELVRSLVTNKRKSK